MKVSRRAFHLHPNIRAIPAGLVRRELFCQSGYGRGKVVTQNRGGAQLVYGIPALGDRLGRLINRAVESLLGFLWTRWEQVRNSLKAKQQPVKTLQQRIV
jgi:hypothetical protein